MGKSGKSGKQRRIEIHAARLKKAIEQQSKGNVSKQVDFTWGSYDASSIKLPKGAIASDPEALVHNNTYGCLPYYYVDRVFCCADCNKFELWTAKQQKWWYEIAKGHIDSAAKYCHTCRRKRQEISRKMRKVHFAGIIEKHGVKRAAQLLDRTVAELEQWHKEQQRD